MHGRSLAFLRSHRRLCRDHVLVAASIWPSASLHLLFRPLLSTVRVRSRDSFALPSDRRLRRMCFLRPRRRLARRRERTCPVARSTAGAGARWSLRTSLRCARSSQMNCCRPGERSGRRQCRVERSYRRASSKGRCPNRVRHVLRAHTEASLSRVRTCLARPCSSLSTTFPRRRHTRPRRLRANSSSA